MTASPDLYQTIAKHQTAGESDRRGWTSIKCPNCDENRKLKSAFNHERFKCFVCGASYPLQVLAHKLDVAVPPENGGYRAFIPKPPKPRYWQREPQKWVERSLAHLQRVELWQAYRPFTLDSIQRWKLGVSPVPSTPCRHARLTYVYMDGACPTLRGRQINCSCDASALKWVTAGNGKAALWGIELLKPGATVVICESPVDAMLAMQKDKSLTAVAGTAGAGTWRNDWTHAITSSSPALVVVAMDNDLQGQAAGDTRPALAQEWLKKHKVLPVANGPKVANILQRAGCITRLFDWTGYPPKADIGWLLTH